jgi:hypothetical protein
MALRWNVGPVYYRSALSQTITFNICSSQAGHAQWHFSPERMPKQRSPVVRHAAGATFECIPIKYATITMACCGTRRQLLVSASRHTTASLRRTVDGCCCCGSRCASDLTTLWPVAVAARFTNDAKFANPVRAIFIGRCRHCVSNKSSITINPRWTMESEEFKEYKFCQLIQLLSTMNKIILHAVACRWNNCNSQSRPIAWYFVT